MDDSKFYVRMTTIVFSPDACLVDVCVCVCARVCVLDLCEEEKKKENTMPMQTLFISGSRWKKIVDRHSFGEMKIFVVVDENARFFVRFSIEILARAKRRQASEGDVVRRPIRRETMSVRVYLCVCAKSRGRKI